MVELPGARNLHAGLVLSIEHLVRQSAIAAAPGKAVPVNAT
jgi:hypothetical protein